ncbi:hypothetical protein [Dactylosporangium sp. NPDC000521]|uniref:hypothetical protein n=1 Tax=Dactylosporangium sp. NPDC000521 TaxID=3363975 RepID=UPI00367E1DFA
MTDGDAGARGVQVGDHNTQTNHFTALGQSPAAAGLQALHPRAAARRIRGMPAEDGAALVAQLAVQPAVDLLEELLRRSSSTRGWSRSATGSPRRGSGRRR